MNNPYSFDWDGALAVIFVLEILLSPALLSLLWAWLTLIPLVRKILIRALSSVIAAPFLSAGIYVIFSRLCATGHFRQDFAECGPVPDNLANWLPFAPLILLVLPAAIAVFYCAILEHRRLFRHD